MPDVPIARMVARERAGGEAVNKSPHVLRIGREVHAAPNKSPPRSDQPVGPPPR